jgi:hypothetical protein
MLGSNSDRGRWNRCRGGGSGGDVGGNGGGSGSDETGGGDGGDGNDDTAALAAQLAAAAEGSGMDTYLEEIDDLDSGADVVEYIRTASPVWATESDRAMRVP